MKIGQMMGEGQQGRAPSPKRRAEGVEKVLEACQDFFLRRRFEGELKGQLHLQQSLIVFYIPCTCTLLDTSPNKYFDWQTRLKLDLFCGCAKPMMMMLWVLSSPSDAGDDDDAVGSKFNCRVHEFAPTPPQAICSRERKKKGTTTYVLAAIGERNNLKRRNESKKLLSNVLQK